MKAFLKNIFGTKISPTNQGSDSEFSRFFREAPSREKKRVYMEVARKASADQRKVLESIR